MRRAIARGRVFPQSFSTDRRYGRLSLKACALFPLMWANADDQGRLCGDPEEIKYAVCPNIDHITKTDIPEVLEDLQANNLIKLYSTAEAMAIQILDWWGIHRPQWAYPSDYPPPEGWQDRLRYHPKPTEIITLNWIPPSQYDRGLPSVLPSNSQAPSPQTPHPEDEDEDERGIRNKEGRRLRSALRSNSLSTSPSTTGDAPLLLTELTSCYKIRWGTVKASDPGNIIPREPGGKMTAQLRDLSTELARHNCPVSYIKEAFDECSGANQRNISYARAILLDWLGIERVHPP